MSTTNAVTIRVSTLAEAKRVGGGGGGGGKNRGVGGGSATDALERALLVSGDTYPLRVPLKKLGAFWQHADQSWVVPRHAHVALLGMLAANGVVARDESDGGRIAEFYNHPTMLRLLASQDEERRAFEEKLVSAQRALIATLVSNEAPEDRRRRQGRESGSTGKAGRDDDLSKDAAERRKGRGAGVGDEDNDASPAVGRRRRAKENGRRRPVHIAVDDDEEEEKAEEGRGDKNGFGVGTGGGGGGGGGDKREIDDEAREAQRRKQLLTQMFCDRRNAREWERETAAARKREASVESEREEEREDEKSEREAKKQREKGSDPETIPVLAPQLYHEPTVAANEKSGDVDGGDGGDDRDRDDGREIKTLQFQFEHLCEQLKHLSYAKTDVATLRERVRRRMVKRLQTAGRLEADKWNDGDMEYLLQQYDDVFFDARLFPTLAERKVAVVFRYGINSQRVAGTCSGSGTRSCTYTLAFNRTIMQSILAKRAYLCNGLSCTSPVACLQLTMEHELVHLLIDVFCPEAILGTHLTKRGRPVRYAHGPVFKRIVGHLFAQTETKHGFRTPLDAAPNGGGGGGVSDAEDDGDAASGGGGGGGGGGGDAAEQHFARIAALRAGDLVFLTGKGDVQYRVVRKIVKNYEVVRNEDQGYDIIRVRPTGIRFAPTKLSEPKTRRRGRRA